jgi:molybdopterin-guanine dinucleotide biosynthesis protein A
MSDDTKKAGWILVGGRSARMGRDKAFVEVEGRALALRVADRIAPVCGSVTLVGDPVIYGALGLPVIEDAFPGQGPLAGIEAALRCTTVDQNLIVACDMPALEIALIEELFAAGGDCAVPQYADGKLEPLCAVYHRRCHATVLSALNSGIRAVKDILRPQTGEMRDSLAVRLVRVQSPAPFANLNTPEDVRKYTNG